MTLWWVGGAALVVATAVGVRRLARRTDPSRELGEIVLTAFGADWSRRFDTDAAALRRALLDDHEPALRREIASAVGAVDITVSRTGTAQRTLTALARCDYAQEQERSKVTLHLDWFDAPADVRAEFLRTGTTEVSRQWTALAGAEAPQ